MKEDTALSLREGVQRHCDENAAVFTKRELSPEAEAFLRCHDVAHVVFGCDTSIVGEGIVKIFTVFGTTLGFRGHLSAYADAKALSLFRRYSARHVLGNIFRLVTTMPRAIVHAKRMSRPWTWSDHSEYLDKTIEEIRKEFNIAVVRYS